MRSTFFGIEMAWRTTEIAKAQFDTISHNIANASREDYSRQEVRVEAMPAYTTPSRFRGTEAGQMGAGAKVAAIERKVNEYLDFVLSRQQMRYDQATLNDELMGHLEQIANDSHLPKELDAFFTAWQEVANHPENIGMREALLSQGKATLASFQHCLSSYHELNDDLSTRLESATTRMNELALQVAQLNKSIAQVEGSGQSPNDLMDQRDAVVRQLVSLTGARTFRSENGVVNVMLDGRPLVQDFSAYEVQLVDAPTGRFEWTLDGTEMNFDAGQIYTLLAARRTIQDRGIAPVEALINDLVNRVNAVHQTGYGLDGVTGRNFFEGSAPLDYQITLSAAQVAAGASAEAGDGSKALEISQLADQTSPLGRSYTSFLNEMLTRIGTLKQDAETNVQAQSTALEEAKAKRQQVSGVSMDEEVMKLLQAQRTLQAAARVMNVMDAALDRVINGMGLVGR